MYCRDNQIHPCSALLAVSAILSLVAICHSEQVTSRSGQAQPIMQRFQKAHDSQRLSIKASNQLKDYYDYRRLDIRNS